MIFELLGFAIMILVSCSLIATGIFVAGFIHSANNNTYNKDVGFFIIMAITGVALLVYCLMFSPISIIFN